MFVAVCHNVTNQSNDAAYEGEKNTGAHFIYVATPV
jgi:hypothetical protein